MFPSGSFRAWYVCHLFPYPNLLLPVSIEKPLSLSPILFPCPERTRSFDGQYPDTTRYIVTYEEPHEKRPSALRIGSLGRTSTIAPSPEPVEISTAHRDRGLRRFRREPPPCLREAWDNINLLPAVYTGTFLRMRGTVRASGKPVARHALCIRDTPALSSGRCEAT